MNNFINAENMTNLLQFFMSATFIILHCSHLGDAGCSAPTFTYWGDNGTSAWSKLYPKYCASTERQSPIDLSLAESRRDESLLSMPTFVFSEIDAGTKLFIENDGVKVHLSYSMPVTMYFVGLPIMQWTLDHIHMHWGAEDKRGSEHTRDGEEFAGESGEKNEELDSWITQLTQTTEPCGEAEVETEGTLEMFLPAGACKHTQFFRYYGSLTTPKCNEVVIWTVFANPISLSPDQLELLRKFTYYNATGGNNTGQMVDNYRPVQILNGRTVTRSFDVYCGAAGVGASFGVIILSAFILFLLLP